MKKTLIAIILLSLVILGANKAEAAFNVDWGHSWDSPHWKGYKYIADWLVDNGYYSNMDDAKHFAKKHYIGYKTSDSDPLYFNPGSYTAEIVYENAGWENIEPAGYYTENDEIFTKFQLFTGPDGVGSGSQTFSVSKAFGIYLHSNYLGGTDWFTDRFDNSAQSGKKLHKFSPQGLIYQLGEDKWLIAWEDIDATICNNDRDYNDMYILLTKTNIPEPASLSLLGLGLLGLLRFRKRTK